jgi:hypothetical protein
MNKNDTAETAADDDEFNAVSNQLRQRHGEALNPGSSTDRVYARLAGGRAAAAHHASSMATTEAHIQKHLTAASNAAGVQIGRDHPHLNVQSPETLVQSLKGIVAAERARRRA